MQYRRRQRRRRHDPAMPVVMCLYIVTIGLVVAIITGATWLAERLPADDRTEPRGAETHAAEKDETGS